MSQRWRTVGNTVSDLNGLRFEPHSSRSTDERVTARPTDWFIYNYVFHLFIHKFTNTRIQNYTTMFKFQIIKFCNKRIFRDHVCVEDKPGIFGTNNVILKRVKTKTQCEAKLNNFVCTET